EHDPPRRAAYGVVDVVHTVADAAGDVASGPVGDRRRRRWSLQRPVRGPSAAGRQYGNRHGRQESPGHGSPLSPINPAPSLGASSRYTPRGTGFHVTPLRPGRLSFHGNTRSRISYHR